jgi:hypothetical protein
LPTAERAIEQVTTPGEKISTAFRSGISTKRPPDKSSVAKKLFAENSEGLFIILRKEISPDDYRVMKRIDKFEYWTNIETEIFDLVRTETKAEFQRTKRIRNWTSGKYLVEIYDKNGKSARYNDVLIDVYAGEDEFPVLEGAGGIPDRDYLIQSSLSPERVAEQNFKMLEKGMEFGNAREIAKGQNETSLITAMMGMFKELMGAGSGKKESLIDTIKELQALGIMQNPDPYAQVEKLKNFAAILSEVAGISQGERPGIGEKIVDMLIPHVPGIVSNLKGMTDNVAAVRLAQRTAPPATVPAPATTLPATQPENGGAPVFNIDQLKEELYNIISQNDLTKFNEITSKIAPLFGGRENLEARIASGNVTAEYISAYLLGLDPRYRPIFLKLQDYAYEYLDSFQKRGAKVIASCEKCGAEWVFDNRENWDNAVREGGNICEADGCGGSLKLIETETAAG